MSRCLDVGVFHLTVIGPSSSSYLQKRHRFVSVFSLQQNRGKQTPLCNRFPPFPGQDQRVEASSGSRGRSAIGNRLAFDFPSDGNTHALVRMLSAVAPPDGSCMPHETRAITAGHRSPLSATVLGITRSRLCRPMPLSPPAASGESSHFPCLTPSFP